MIISSFYNKEEETLILMKISTNNQEKKIIKEDNIVKIYTGAELIGINILKYQNAELESGIVKNDLIKNEITKYFGDEIENPYIVGKILEINPHPKSKKLNICKVDLGTKEEQIVCGASNVAVNKLIIVSVVGAVMPDGMEIKKSKVIDIESNGMITSLYELGLSSDKAQGIAILDETYNVGDYFAK